MQTRNRKHKRSDNDISSESSFNEEDSMEDNMTEIRNNLKDDDHFEPSYVDREADGCSNFGWNKNLLTSHKKSTTPSPNKDTTSSPNKSITPTDASRGSSNYWQGLLIATLSGLLVYYINGKTPSYYNCSEQINNIRNEFSEQTTDFHGAIKLTLNYNNQYKKNVSSILLLHHPGNDMLVSCLINKVVDTHAKCIGSPKAHSEISFEDINANTGDYGQLIDKYRKHITGAFVVKELDRVLPHNAPMFHSLCDDVTLLHPPTLCIFTIETTDTVVDKKSWLLARNILERAWISLETNVLDPLLNRILIHVHQIKPQSNFTCSMTET